MKSNGIFRKSMKDLQEHSHNLYSTLNDQMTAAKQRNASDQLELQT